MIRVMACNENFVNRIAERFAIIFLRTVLVNFLIVNLIVDTNKEITICCFKLV